MNKEETPPVAADPLPHDDAPQRHDRCHRHHRRPPLSPVVVFVLVVTLDVVVLGVGVVGGGGGGGGSICVLFPPSHPAARHCDISRASFWPGGDRGGEGGDW
jgi:hypothetical protein